MSYNAANKQFITAVILLLIVIGQAAIDIYLPSMPYMVGYFHTTEYYVQLSVTVYLLSFALSQIIYGPLADHWGRKPILIWGLTLFLVASLMCVFAHSINTLLLGRFLQGAGISAASVISRAIMRDLFEGKQLVKVASYTAMAWAIVPIVAPVLGGYFQTYFSWQMSFAFLSFFAVLLLFSILLKLPETGQIKNQYQNFSWRQVINNYKVLLTNRVFMGHVLAVSCLYGIFVSFNVIGPFLLQLKLGLSPVAYGWTLVVISAGYFIGSYLNSKLSQKYPIRLIVKYGFVIALISCIAILITPLLHLFNLSAVVTLMFIILLSIGFIYANCIAGCMKPFPHIAGSAAALYGGIVFLGGSMAGFVASHIANMTQLSLGYIILILTILALFMFFYMVPKSVPDL